MESFRRVTVKHANLTLEFMQCIGATANLNIVSNIQPPAGDSFLRWMMREHGRSVHRQRHQGGVLPNVDAVGKTISVDGRPFEVIGVAKTLGSVFGQSRDSFVMIPIGTYFKMYGARSNIGYNALALDQGRLYEAQDEIRTLLRSYRHLRPNQEDTFGMAGSESLQQVWGQLTGAIAATRSRSYPCSWLSAGS
jgi:putative ABC transport system permease protein